MVELSGRESRQRGDASHRNERRAREVERLRQLVRRGVHLEVLAEEILHPLVDRQRRQAIDRVLRRGDDEKALEGAAADRVSRAVERLFEHGEPRNDVAEGSDARQDRAALLEDRLTGAPRAP